MAETRSRIDCPACGREVAARDDGSPRSHYPPVDRPDLRCGAESGGHTTRASHCQGSHTPPARETLAVRASGTPVGIGALAAILRNADVFEVVYDSGITEAHRPGHVKVYMQLRSTR